MRMNNGCEWRTTMCRVQSCSICTGLKLTVKYNDAWDQSLAAWSVESLVNTPANVPVWSVYLLFSLQIMPCGYCVFSDWFLLRNNSIILINFMQECAAYFFYILVCHETLPSLENVENISGQKPTTLAKKIETVENHDKERTLFDALNHECRAKIVFSGCALGADRSWSSTVSHDRTASYRHHDSRPSHFFFFWPGSRSPVPQKKPRRSPGLNHTVPNRIADQKHCALSAQPNPCLHVQKRFIGEFRRRLSYRYRRPRRMLIMDKQKPYGSSPGFSRVFSRHWGSRLLCRKISFHVLLSYPGQPFSF